MGHGLSPPRYGGPGPVHRKAADDARYGIGGGGGGTANNNGIAPPPGNSLRNPGKISFGEEPRETAATAAGGQGRNEAFCTTSLSPKKGEGYQTREGGRGRSELSEKFPMLPAQALSAAAAAEADGAGPTDSLNGKRGRARRASSLGAQTGGWIHSRQTPETLQELLQTT